MLSLQIEHIDDTLEIYVDRQINKLNRLMHNILNPRIACEICNRPWDNISPCALCNATHAVSSGRI